MFQGVRSAQVRNPLIEGKHCATDQDHHRDHERPEEYFLAITEWMMLIGRLVAAINAKKQERAVAGIDQRMNALRNHRSASAAVSCDKFKRGNNQVGGYRSENRFWLFPHTKRVSLARRCWYRSANECPPKSSQRFRCCILRQI